MAVSKSNVGTGPTWHPVEVGLHQYGVELPIDEKQANQRSYQMILRALTGGRTIAFVGSGMSKQFGMPSWQDLTEGVVEQFQHVMPEQAALVSGKKTPKEILPRLEVIDRLLASTPRLPTQAPLPRVGGIVADLVREQHKTDGTPLQMPPDELNPIRTIVMQLGIRRFVTTNYDNAIESTLASLDLRMQPSEKLDLKQYQIGMGSRQASSLLQFAYGAARHRAGVFHCHGHYLQPDSMIVTENDYQRAYESGHKEATAYRQALKLLLTSNPVLFLGYGMTEADLLRSLRQFMSERRLSARDQPIFAILPRILPAKRLLHDQHDLLHKYNVKVCYYGSFAEFKRAMQADNQGKNRKAAPGPNKTTQYLTKAFIEFTEQLARDAHRWWSGWLEKPPVRQAMFSSRPAKRGGRRGTLMVRHYDPNLTKGRGPDSDSARLEADLARIQELLLKPETRVLILFGGPGAAKGSIGQRLVTDQEHASGHWSKSFFATAHFSNDFHSAVDGARGFLTGDHAPSPDVDRYQALFEAVDEHGALVVLGGFDRMLSRIPTSQLEAVPLAIPQQLPHQVGKAATPEAGYFIHLLSEFAKQSREGRIVLTSSRLPIELLQADVSTPASPGVRIFDLSSNWKSELRNGLAGSEVPTRGGRAVAQQRVATAIDAKQREVSELTVRLRHSIRGHAFALSVLERTIAKLGGTGEAGQARKCDYLARMLWRVSTAEKAERPERLIAECIATWTQSQDDTTRGRFANELLQRIALFTTPVGQETISVCMGQVGATEEQTRELISQAVERGLVIHIEDYQNRRQFDRYTVHTTVREHCLHTTGVSREISGEPLKFDLNGFDKDWNEPQTASREGNDLSTQCAEALLRDASSLKADAKRPQARREHQEALRSIYGLLRSKWSATSIPRLHEMPAENRNGRQVSHYDAFHFRLVRLINLVRRREESVYALTASRRAARRLDGPFWYDEVTDHRESVQRKDATLYADELSWLYNELGLTWYCQGFLVDANSAFRVGNDINVVIEGPVRGQRWCQSQINMALIQIERGHVGRGEKYLRRLVQVCVEPWMKEVHTRAMGYYGWVRHLSGEFDDAVASYSIAIRAAKRASNQRALSNFRRLRADLFRWRMDTDKARQDMRESIAAAEMGQHPDLLEYARVAESILRLNSGDRRVSIDNLQPSLTFAQQVGIPKLEADVYKVQGEIALRRGDLEHATHLALRCLSLATSLEMRLRVTAALGLLGRTFLRRRDHASGIELLKSAANLGRQQGYQLQVEAAVQAQLQR